MPSSPTIVTGLANDTAYQFRVAAVNGIGQGALSAVSNTVIPAAFLPIAVILTRGTRYRVPLGAGVVKAWAIGAGGGGSTQLYGNGGGVAYKTWNVTPGTSVYYSLADSSTTVTYGGVTITATAGSTSGPGGAAGTFSGGDGGANGGIGVRLPLPGNQYRGGAIGGNGSESACYTTNPTDVSGLFAAVAAAGGSTVDTCSGPAAFGSGGFGDYSRPPGIGGGAGYQNINSGNRPGGLPGVVLYFTLS
jgi:hypothetical protein